MSNNAALTRAVPEDQRPVEVLWLPASTEPRHRPGVQGPLLVDASGSGVPEGALRLAQVLARRDGVEVQVTSAARPASAAYVLSGLPPLGTSERDDTARTALRLAREAGAPVLVVPSQADLLPRSVLAAVDTGDEASIRAALAAIPLLGEGGSVTVVHVAPSPAPSDGSRPAEPAPRVAEVLRKLAKDIAAAADIPVHLAVPRGDPPTLLADWVPEFDLVTLGAASPERLDPAPATRVSTVAFRHARGALLVAAAAGPTYGGR